MKLWIVGAMLTIFGLLLICFLTTFFLDFTLSIASQPSKAEELIEKRDEVLQGAIAGSILIASGSILTFISLKIRVKKFP